jgi:hypothetical protein
MGVRQMFFPIQAKFKTDYDENHFISVIGYYQLTPNIDRHFTVITFVEMVDAKNFFQQGIDWCKEHETQIPKPFVNGMEAS